MKVHSVSRDRWQSQRLAEVPFLAADAKGEDVFFRGAEPLLAGRVLLTGYAAGAWARRERPLTELLRADQSGLSRSEYRLWAGFLNLPLPTMGLRSGGDIYRVNLSDDMKNWYSGRKYDKPFCRRVLSEAGVDDSMFGGEKKAASVLMFDRRTFLSPKSLDDFHQYMAQLRSRHGSTIRKHQSRIWLRSVATGLSVRTASFLPGKFFQRVRSSVRLNETAFRSTEYDYLFGWATKHAVERYRDV